MRIAAATNRLALVGLAVLSACSDALEQTSSRGDAVVIVSARSDSVSLVTVQGHVPSVLGVPPPGATPGTVAVLGSLLAVPGGDSAVLTVFGFDDGRPAADTTWHLPTGPAGAVAFESDSIVWVANPTHNTVTRLNIHTGGVTTFTVGTDPEAVAVVNHQVYVVNANARSGVPAGPSWITVLAAGGGLPLTPDSTPLTGTNARFATVGEDGFLYVVESGTAGLGDGKLSIVDTVSRREQAVLNGLGDSPGALVYHPTGRVLIASAAEGLLEVNSTTRALTRGPGDGVKPTGVRFAALTLDATGRVYALDQGDCTGPGVLYVLSPPPEYEVSAEVPVGVCPVSAATVLIP